MSTDKWTTSKSTQLQQKFGSNCSLQDFVNAVFPTLTKQTILPTYYSNSDAHYSHIILNKNVHYGSYYSQIIHKPLYTVDLEIGVRELELPKDQVGMSSQALSL